MLRRVSCYGGSTSLRNDRLRRCALLCLASLAIPTIVYARSFGTHSTESYQNSYQAPLPGADTCISRMNTELTVWWRNPSTQKFWYNLQGKQYYWHETGDQATNSLESVDMFVTFTHGGATSSAHSEWAMWDYWALASSDSMRLGDEGVGTSIFTQFSCDTLRIDSYTWARWDSVFAGGLRAALGSHGDLHWGEAEYDVGKVFAQYMTLGNTLKTSWAAGWDLTIYDNQDVAVMFTGSNQSDCESRRDNMTWNNFGSYPRLQDGAISYWCYWYWDDI